MARIDALVATQVGDVVRPSQSTRDSEAQAAQALRSLATKPETSALASEPTADELRGSIQRMQKVIEVATGRKLQFDLNDQFKELVVKISDRSSGEVLKEIPSKEFMRLRERLHDMIGLFIDEKA